MLPHKHIANNNRTNEKKKKFHELIYLATIVRRTRSATPQRDEKQMCSEHSKTNGSPRIQAGYASNWRQFVLLVPLWENARVLPTDALTVFDLSDNQIGDIGAGALSDACTCKLQENKIPITIENIENLFPALILSSFFLH